MKRFNFLKSLVIAGSAIIGTTFGANAEIVTSEYYGTHANSSNVNPCSGETTRLCARKTKEVIKESGNMYVLETVEDASGCVVGQ